MLRVNTAEPNPEEDMPKKRARKVTGKKRAQERQAPQPKPKTRTRPRRPRIPSKGLWDIILGR